MRLVLAAMGPKMCELAGAEFDGAFFNWMTPEFAAGAREKVEAGAAEAGRDAPPVFGYVRTAVGPDAAERLAKEESFYRDLHDGYRNHFARLGEPEGTVGVAAAGPGRRPGRARRLHGPRHRRRPRPASATTTSRPNDRAGQPSCSALTCLSTAAGPRTTAPRILKERQKRCLAPSSSSDSSMSGV